MLFKQKGCAQIGGKFKFVLKLGIKNLLQKLKEICDRTKELIEHVSETHCPRPGMGSHNRAHLGKSGFDR